MTNVVSPAGTFGYQYFDSRPSTLVSRLTLPNGATITNGYDSLARLTRTALNNSSGQTLDAYSYLYDPLGLRTNVTRNLGSAISTATAGYDAIGQLTGWTAKETNTVRLNEQLGWAYDAAHNLHLRTNGALIQTFTVDTANELTNVTRMGTLTVAGDTLSAATSVTVNNQAAQKYGDLTFANTNNTLYDGNNSFTVIAQNAGGVKRTNSLTVNLPVADTLLYDNNGNLTNDGLRSLSYDNENQLTNVMVAGQWRATYVYDGLGRRRITRDYTWQSGWLQTNEIHYVYDRMLPIQERDMNNNPLVTYTRGLDLTGSLQDAGGIGGLLARTDGNGSTFYHADGAGNITALMNDSQNIVARYLYNPYGKLVGEWGGMAEANKYRFSSKELDPLSGMYSYGFRFYDPNLQRWPNQDPIGENGGINLYGFVDNNPVNYVDPMGLWWAPFLNPDAGKPRFGSDRPDPLFKYVWVNNGSDYSRVSDQLNWNIEIVTGVGGLEYEGEQLAAKALQAARAARAARAAKAIKDLMAGKVKCKVNAADLDKLRAAERDVDNFLGVLDKNGTIKLFKQGENGINAHSQLVEQGLANKGDLGFSVGLDANGQISVQNMSGLNMPLGLGGQLPAGLYNAVVQGFGAN